MTRNSRFSIASTGSMGTSGFYFRSTYPAGISQPTQNPDKDKKLFLWQNTILPEADHQDHPKGKYGVYW